jgi:hypothetical protein
MIKVVKLKILSEYWLRATFSDGMAGEYDFSAIVDPINLYMELRDAGALTRVAE